MLLLLACAPTNEDLREVVEANTEVLEGLHLSLETLEVKADRHGKGDGRYLYNGTVGSGLGWNAGTIQVTGESFSDNSGAVQTYDLELDYEQVESLGRWMDGPVSWTMTVLIDAGRLEMDYSVDGELLIDESWEAVLAYERRVVPTEEDFQLHWSGTINDIAVSSLL